MATIRTLIVDDEAPARWRLHKLCTATPDLEVVAECSGGACAVQSIRSEHPDLVFLDIQMRDMDGFDVLDAVGVTSPPVFVFVTAYDRYAVQAFESSALDYLLKPFSDERFEKAIDRARRFMLRHQLTEYSDRLLDLLRYHDRHAGRAADHLSVDAASDGTSAGDRLILKTGGRLVFVDAGDVDRIEAEGVYVRVHTGPRSYLLRESLTTVEERLDPTRFLRIHRSTIVNIDHVKEIVPHANGGSVVVLRNGTQAKLSRTYRDKVTATLG